MVFGQLLVEANIAFRIIVGQNRTHSAQKHRNSLMPSSKTMVKV